MPSPEWTEFVAMLENLANAALKLAAERYPSGPTMTTIRRPVFGDRSADVEEVEQARASSDLLALRDEIEALPEFTGALAALSGMAGIARDAAVRAGAGDTEPGRNNIAHAALLGYLGGIATTEFAIDAGVSSRTLQDLNAYAVDGKRTLRLRAFLKGLTLPGTMELGPITLRPVIEGELSDVFRTLDTFLGEFQALRRMWGETIVAEIMITCDVEKVESKAKHAGAQLADALLFLRLCFNPRAYVLCTITTSDTFSPSHSSPNLLDSIPGTTIAIDPDTTRSAWEEIRETLATKPKRIALALRRFTSLCDHDRGHDRVLEQTIILEALLSDSSKSELTHKLALRVAYLLGTSFDDRKRFFKIVKKAYEIRSKLTHGEAAEPEWGELVQALDPLVPRVIRGYIAAAGAGGDVVARLDDMVLGAT
jgi:hypothetical protein